MSQLFDFPVLLGLFSLVVLALSAWAGARFLRREQGQGADSREDFSMILGPR